MAVLSGLNHGCVSRLKTTWTALPKQCHTTFEQLSTLMQSSGNYKTYRKEISVPKFPCLPYFAVYLRDLTFIEDGNQDFLQQGIVNFQKMRMLAKVFGDMQRFQRTSYDIKDIDEIQKYLKEEILIMRGDKELYKYSKICEPSTRAAEDGRSMSRSVSVSVYHT